MPLHRFATPLGIFLLLVVLLGVGLTLNPRRVPSPLVNKPVPEFELSTVLDPGLSFSQEDLRGRVSLLNVWATWCVPCRDEHPVLVGIARRGESVIYGLNYKDDRDKATAWLQTLGNPYEKSGFDPAGRAGIDLGVYGVPETFIVDADGTIVYKHIGPIDEKIWREQLRPLVKQAAEKQG
ncbi:MAG TPA: DsbE family thiol:disulfide interchange protein [Gammaproteobacteria bacterium]|nr:DsbE family thiol:disulfide interchange protein [Gammaproteobacteria bacterium]